MLILVASLLITIGLLGFLATFVVVYKKLNTAQLSLNALTSKTREHHQGLSFKVPWATLQKPEISMQSEIIITSGGILIMSWEQFVSQKLYEKIAPRIYETLDSIIYGSWATAIRPRKGSLDLLIRKTPQTASIMVMAEVDIAVSDYLATRETTIVLHDKKAISTMLANVFGGDDEEAKSPIEDAYGIVVSNPRLFGLNLGKKSQDAAEDVFAAQKLSAALAEVKTGAGNDAEKAVNAFLMYSGKGVQKHIYNVEGLQAIAEAFFRRNN